MLLYALDTLSCEQITNYSLQNKVDIIFRKGKFLIFFWQILSRLH